MGDQEQRTILSRGTHAWNQWRQATPEITPDLSGFDMGKEDLGAIHFSHADLSGTVLNGAYLRGAQLDGADLSSAALHDADLRDADLRNASLIGADLRGADLRGADLRGADLRETLLGGINGSNANWSTAVLDHAQMTEARFIHADFSYTNLNETSFHHSLLTGANFQYARLYDVQLREADLSNATFRYALLRHVNMQGAVLLEADFRHATVMHTQFHANRFHHTSFASAIFGWNFFSAVDLRGVTDIETVEHLGPSEISSSVFYTSHGMIPHHFLRGAGVPQTLIEHIPLLMQEARDTLTCFICCARADHHLAQRLHQDLQQARVRCWITYVDQEPVRHFWYIQDDPTETYDILILLLSSHTPLSEIKTLVALARQKEEKQRKKVLLPLMIDQSAEAFQEIFFAWPAFDWSGWENLDIYQRLSQRIRDQVEMEK